MGVDVFLKGAPTTWLKCPFGIQGGQAGQFLVAVVFSKEPLVKVTVQMQRAKGNAVAKAKRAMFDTAVLMRLLPFLLRLSVSQQKLAQQKANPKRDAKKTQHLWLRRRGLEE